MVVNYCPYYEIFEKLDLNVQKQICNMIIKESILRIENNSSLNENFKNMFIESIHKQFEVDKKRLANKFLEKIKINLLISNITVSFFLLFYKIYYNYFINNPLNKTLQRN